MRKALFAVILGAGLIAATPSGLRADDHDRDHKEKRYYDRDAKDYHAWNQNEDRAYRHWLTEERHGRYHDYARAKRDEQREYWKWRHEHADWH